MKTLNTILVIAFAGLLLVSCNEPDKKEQLKKQLQESKNLERKELIEKHYPKFKKQEGNCYKKKK